MFRYFSEYQPFSEIFVVKIFPETIESFEKCLHMFYASSIISDQIIKLI